MLNHDESGLRGSRIFLDSQIKLILVVTEWGGGVKSCPSLYISHLFNTRNNITDIVLEVFVVLSDGTSLRIQCGGV